jgi:transposase
MALVYLIVVQAVSGIVLMAAVTNEFRRAVMDTIAPARIAALRPRSRIMTCSGDLTFSSTLRTRGPTVRNPRSRSATAYGVGPETLRNWLIKYREANGGTESDLTVSERARLKELERENQELKAEAQFLNYSDVRIMPMFA